MIFRFNRVLKPVTLALMAVGLLTACNKDVADPTPIPKPSSSTTGTIADLVATDATLSIFRTAATRVPSLLAMLGDRDAIFTAFVPDNAAFQRSGITEAMVAGMPLAQLTAILQYHVVGGQRISSAQIPTTFPNIQLPTQLTLAPPSPTLPPGLRMSLFPSRRATAAWANNIPITGADIQTANGVVHKVATILLPPQQMLWERINTDPQLTYLKAAVQRADMATPSPNLVAGLSNPAANLTVFAPTDAAMQQFLIGSITQALMTAGLPAANAQAAATALVTNYGTTIISNPASIPDAPIFPAGTGIGNQLAAVLSPTTVAGLVAYHLLGTRVFSVNLPTAATEVNTALSAQIPAAKLTVQATFGATGVTAATVKGLANATAAAIQINPTPAPGGTSDQHYVNGVLHVINQVLRPQ